MGLGVRFAPGRKPLGIGSDAMEVGLKPIWAEPRRGCRRGGGGGGPGDAAGRIVLGGMSVWGGGGGRRALFP